MLIVVGGFLALSLNVGHLMNARTQMQSALDSAALAGARELNGTSSGIAGAKNVAVTFGTRHFLDSIPVGMGISDVIPGYWDMTARRFYATGDTAHIGDSDVTLDPAATPTFYNAVSTRSVTDAVGAHNSRLDVHFGTFLGNAATAHVGAAAVAVGGGPCSNDHCTLNLAVPSCSLVVDGGGNVACGTNITLYFNHGYGKQIALADITQPSRTVNNNEERDQMAAGAACTSPPVRVGDTIALGNGNDFTSQVEARMRTPNNIVCAAPAPYTGCPSRELAVVNIGTNCDVPMNQTATVVGFVKVIITGTNPLGVDASINVFLDCSGETTAPTGCANFGWGSPRLRLVR